MLLWAKAAPLNDRAKVNSSDSCYTAACSAGARSGFGKTAQPALRLRLPVCHPDLVNSVSPQEPKDPRSLNFIIL